MSVDMAPENSDIFGCVITRFLFLLTSLWLSRDILMNVIWSNLYVIAFYVIFDR